MASQSHSAGAGSRWAAPPPPPPPASAPTLQGTAAALAATRTASTYRGTQGLQPVDNENITQATQPQAALSILYIEHMLNPQLARPSCARGRTSW